MIKNRLEQIRRDEKEPSEEETIFRGIITEEVIDQMSQELKAAGLDDKNVNEFTNELMKIDDWEELSALLSLPMVIRKKLFVQFSDKTGPEIVEVLKEKLKIFLNSAGSLPKLGFHTSGSEIRITENQKGDPVWDIRGTEMSDLAEGKQAFATDNFSNLYHEGLSDKLYIVRLGLSAKKFRDREGHWHDSSFPIVAKLDTEDIYQKIRNKLRKQAA